MNKYNETENLNKPLWLKYFFFIGEYEKKLIKLWAGSIKPKTKNQKNFLRTVKCALKTITHEYWISTIEPSKKFEPAYNFQLYFREFSEEYYPAKFSFGDWEKLAGNFAPEWNSTLADWYELILFYAYRIAKSYWTIEFVCDDSCDYTHPSWLDFAFVASRKIGGFCDGVDNTYKITKHKSKFIVSGRPYYEKNPEPTIVSFYYEDDPHKVEDYGSGVIVLRGNPYKTQKNLSRQIFDPETNELILKAKKSINDLAEVVSSNDFYENNETIATIISRLYELVKNLELPIYSRYNYVHLFEVYLPEFYNLLKYCSELQDSLTAKDKELLANSVKKFYDFLASPKFNNTTDVETAKIKFNSTANSLINALNKED